MECYLDNSATTKPTDAVVEAMLHVLRDDFGNPSSLHAKGVGAEEVVKDARAKIAATLRVKPKEILFTSGGTESNNQALIGAARARHRHGKHIISTCFEHPSVYEPLEFLRREGYDVDYLPVDAMGHVDPELLEATIREDTILVSTMFVNNEVGAVQDIEALSRRIHAKNPEILYHVDAIQAYGKLLIRPQQMGIDLMSVSGHKIHGPKGSGFLYVRDGVRILPYIYGGGQEKNLRSGTENVPGIAGLGAAAHEIYTDFHEKQDHLFRLKTRMIGELLREIPDVRIHAVELPDTGDDEALEAAVRKTAPHIVSAAFPPIRAEVLLHALEDKGIYVSSGSACASNHPAISGTLKGIGVPEEELTTTLRFSFSVHTTEEEVLYAVQALRELVPILSRFVRR